MPSDVTFTAITAFRLVSAAPERLSAFYRAIGFDVGEMSPIPPEEMSALGLSGGGSRLAMTVGRTRVDLDVFECPGRAYPAHAMACDQVFQHLALVTDDVDGAWRLADAAGATPISQGGPVRLPASAGGVVALKCRDPEGHPLEFLYLPKAVHRASSGKPVSGADHSALCVADLAASKGFYARHGLCEGTATLNQGPTQAALDGLDDVEVDVVPMTPPKEPPHVELLSYRRPMGVVGADLCANDIAATRIVWRSDHAALLRDPDGHLHQLMRAGQSPEDTGWRR